MSIISIFLFQTIRYKNGLSPYGLVFFFLVTLSIIDGGRFLGDTSCLLAQNAKQANGLGSFDVAEGAYLPSDRLAERRLDLAKKLIIEKRWSDVVTLLDEILSSDRDSFFRSNDETSTWRSVK